MDFSNDDEIAELLNLSSSVIKEIQRAEVKGPQTLGQPQVAPGNTSHLKELWEKESGTQTKPEAKSGSDEHNALPEDVQGPPKTTDEQDKGPTARAEASVNTSLAHPDNDAPSDLDKALSKLEKKREAELNADKSLKKGHWRRAPISRATREGENRPEGQSHEAEGQSAGRTNEERCLRITTTTAPGHRREYSIINEHGSTLVESWCNPNCTPIRAYPRREKCICRRCPTTCILCRDDNDHAQRHRD